MPTLATTLTLSAPTDVRRTVSPLRRGFRDPAFQQTTDGAFWRTTRVPSGPATVRIRQVGPCDVEVAAWGAGADDALAGVPAALGALDDCSGFDPPHGLVRDAHRRLAHVRIGRTGLVLEALVPAILEQRVITKTAHDAWRHLLVRHGEPAPGPAPDGMRVPPSADGWAQVPVWDFHRAGVDPQRARTVLAAARVAGRLQEVVDREPGEVHRRLLTVPGIGPWTVAETVQRALGDPDAVSVGDYHLAGQVGWALAGEKVDDDGMLALLEPYRGHRYRAIRYLLLSGLARVPRRGPRLAVEDHRSR
ncbi:DNA-3-methyladenine glycosylase [Actinotalea sp. Marseille-Q4924]|uniref:DNA-3-methyladenine glycosylase family protein n=1 Tax=Actinotalea sp. Marseille-Q4924 TaxID=2866571 RepID=UPI001CE45EF7|nr:DNA-3-methyladenine glycosylase 2 family protein [Actinotalea sp. Marseille-Q4924]